MKKNQLNTLSYKKNKNKSRNIKSLQNQQGKILTNNFEILQECKITFKIYTQNKKHVKKLKTYF